MKKGYILVTALVLLGLLLIGCQKNADLGKYRNESITLIQAESSCDDEKDIEIQEDPPTELFLEKDPIKEENIKNVGDTVVLLPVTGNADDRSAGGDFCVLDASISQDFRGESLGNYEKMILDGFHVDYDTAGNILSEDYLYVWVNVRITARDSALEWTPVDNVILPLNEDMTLGNDSFFSVICYLNGMTETGNSHDNYWIHFERGEEKNILLGFLVRSDCLNLPHGYYISHVSAQSPDQNSFLVMLNKSESKGKQDKYD